MFQKLIILDFGSQYTQLIARRVRELHIYCEIHPFNHIPTIDDSVKGIILSGSPCSVLELDAPYLPETFWKTPLPVLGICYGAQLMAHIHAGKIERSAHREFGRSTLQWIDRDKILMNGVKEGSTVWMSHGDSILELPNHCTIISKTESAAIAAFQSDQLPFYGVQFHPEVTHSEFGKTILKNFTVHICGFLQTWTPESFVESSIAQLQQLIGKDQVVMGLSGGVDSTVAAVMLQKAIGDQLTCIFVNNGLLRKNEFEEVLNSYQHLGLNIKGVDASALFYQSLSNQTDPEIKRKAIGKTFIDVFDAESKLLHQVKWLGQGTIYPDVIESVSVKGPSMTIKSHHNVGGLPEKMNLKVVEPLRSLFKDEVREVGKTLQIPDEILSRHPFPGPGLAIRIIGDITAEKVRIIQEVDHIFITQLKKQNLYASVWQAGAILLPVQSVGVMGDERTYENVVALRAVTSIDGMTADWAHLPYEFLAQVSNQIINSVKGVNRVVYDISSKPPATIEWE